MKDVKERDIIEVSANVSDSGWIGCIMIVDEVKEWGVLASMVVPFKGWTSLRLNWDEFDLIGKEYWE